MAASSTPAGCSSSPRPRRTIRRAAPRAGRGSAPRRTSTRAKETHRSPDVDPFMHDAEEQRGGGAEERRKSSCGGRGIHRRIRSGLGEHFLHALDLGGLIGEHIGGEAVNDVVLRGVVGAEQLPAPWRSRPDGA